MPRSHPPEHAISQPPLHHLSLPHTCELHRLRAPLHIHSRCLALERAATGFEALHIWNTMDFPKGAQMLVRASCPSLILFTAEEIMEYPWHVLELGT